MISKKNLTRNKPGHYYIKIVKTEWNKNLIRNSNLGPLQYSQIKNNNKKKI